MVSTIAKVIIGFMIGGIAGFVIFGDSGIGIELGGKLIFAIAGAIIALALDNL
ncbi:hypothetical protein [Lentibacillus amyloliquefaciens]|uniref:hypothetical protein n=1 Tax=Lentibacillus amyloliquefaciens TaxID=1472767 RepID=UPI0012E367A8|nr:hypothetical protein [Lentibacillus amyloliquefaciens]